MPRYTVTCVKYGIISIEAENHGQAMEYAEGMEEYGVAWDDNGFYATNAEEE